jgi:hypothetical protein
LIWGRGCRLLPPRNARQKPDEAAPHPGAGPPNCPREARQLAQVVQESHCECVPRLVSARFFRQLVQLEQPGWRVGRIAAEPPPLNSKSANTHSAGVKLTGMNAIICQAIRERRRLQFNYRGIERVVDPYVHGWDADGHEKLRAIQIRGGGSKVDSGKLWVVGEMSGVLLLAEKFIANDPKYNPNDAAIPRICCRV